MFEEHYGVWHYEVLYEMMDVRDLPYILVWSDKEKAAYECIADQETLKWLDEQEAIEENMLTTEEWWQYEEEVLNAY